MQLLSDPIATSLVTPDVSGVSWSPPAGALSGAASTGRLRVAMATEDGVHVNASLVLAASLAVFEVTAGASALVRLLGFSAARDADRPMGTDQLTTKLGSLFDCDLLFVSGNERPSRGASRAATVNLARSTTISAVLQSLRSLLQQAPSS